jgi:hypothetical protein
MALSNSVSPAPPPSTTPDPLVGLNSNETATPLVQQTNQQNEIISLQDEDPGNLVIEGVLGGLPVAEKNQEYFAVVFEAGDTSPELIEQTQFKVVWLCDSFLNVSKPSDDSVALSNVTQNFERQRYATVRVDQGTVLNQQLAGTHQITAVGSLEPIAGTQIGKGPREYVTTMSFQLFDQLGAAPGIDVETYYMWLNKSTGYQNKFFSYQTGGTITYTGEAWGYGSEINSASTENPMRTNYDSEQVSSGSAVSKGTDGPIPSGFDSDNYFDKIDILTGSIEGNTRIKIRGAMSINVATSSVADLFLSAYYGDDVFPYYIPVDINVYRSGSTTGKELLANGTAITYRYNPSLGAQYNGSVTAATNYFRTGDLNNLPGFSWKPTTTDGSPVQFAGIEIQSDYFTVYEGDTIFAEIVAPEESTGSINPFLAAPPQSGVIPDPNIPTDDENSEGVLYFTESLSYWRDEAALRKYQYYGGFMIVEQETPEGINFVQGVTGVTASYFTSESGVGVTQTAYNYTGSYWIDYNNFSSSEDGVGSYITSSTALANFYGGEYYQINPGTEEYNVVNANATVSSSLFVDLGGGKFSATDKYTWDRFGFNPIRLSFTPRAGDFIRFEYSKQKLFQITGVFSFDNVLKFKLNKQIDASTVLDNFVIYRIVEDGQYIILDVEKNNEAGIDQAFSGIITAEYRSENLEDRTDELLFDLKQAGIIQDGAALSRGKVASPSGK